MNLPFLQPTWRWYGPDDAVTLSEIRQVGATGVVTALHHIPAGEVWPVAEIRQRQQLITEAGLTWSVVESVNVSESIKTAAPDREEYLEKYRQTLVNLAACGIYTVCYNFMPVLDWTRTDLAYPVADGSLALRCDVRALAAFDLYVLKRPGATDDFSNEQQTAARQFLDELSEEERHNLQQNLMAGLPGTRDVYEMDAFRQRLSAYDAIDAAQLKENLFYFLRAVVPTAEEVGVRLAIHPDDPPFPVMGLPRIVSTETDLKELVEAAPSPSNGLTFCTGSLGGRGDNDLPGIVERLGQHIHFIHLRNVQREADGSFYEADHLGGSTDMFAVMRALINEQQARQRAGRDDLAIPMRPDHGHQTLFDAGRPFFPGYSAVGRMRGLAELRGLELGIRRMMP
ncbi:MAG: mannonate dehydratase [Tunicatimonas sp.]